MVQIGADQDILDILKKNRLVIYGTGYVAMKFYKALVMNGLDGQIEFFVVSTKENDIDEIEGIKVRSIDEVKIERDLLVCIAVHETIKKDIEQMLDSQNVKKHIWISPYIYILTFGKPIKMDINASVSKVIKANRDYRIAIRYLAIENYFGENRCGFDIYMKAHRLFCGKITAKKRLLSFCRLVKDWEDHGYDKSFKILIDDGYRLLDGAHRIALAKYHQIDDMIGDVYRSSPVFTEWTGNNVLLTKDTMADFGFTDGELRIIEDTDRRLRGE